MKLRLCNHLLKMILGCLLFMFSTLCLGNDNQSIVNNSRSFSSTTNNSKFTVEMVVPKNNSKVNQDLRMVRLKFSEEIDAESIKDGYIKWIDVMGKREEPLKRQIRSDEPTILSIMRTSEADLPPNKQYEILIDKRVASKNGDTLGQDARFNFNTGGGVDPDDPTKTKKRIFVTVRKFNGHLGGFDGANRECQIEAGKDNGIWKALLYDNKSTKLFVEYYRAKNSEDKSYEVKIATASGDNLVYRNSGDLGTLDNSIIPDTEDGKEVWTGMQVDYWHPGDKLTYVFDGACREGGSVWVNNGGFTTERGVVGNALGKGGYWAVSGSISAQHAYCSNKYHLYCVEQ